MYDARQRIEINHQMAASSAAFEPQLFRNPVDHKTAIEAPPSGVEGMATALDNSTTGMGDL